MIRLMGLVDLRGHSIGKDRTALSEAIPPDDMAKDGQGPDPSTVVTGDEGNMTKAQLLNIQKQTAELYNMTNDNEGIEAWLQEKLSSAAELINVVYTYLQYENKKPKSVGDGDGTPADPNQSDAMSDTNSSRV